MYAQKPRAKNLPTHDDRLLHFGFTVGLNTMDFGVRNSNEYVGNTGDTYYADVYKLQPGFHVSIVSNLRLNEYMDLRFLPGIAFGERELNYINILGAPHTEFPSVKVNSSFLDFPLLLKYKGKRINNFRPYLISGGNMRIDLAKKSKYDEENGVLVLLKPLDFYYEIGFGFDSYLQYFKLTTEIRYSIGIRNVFNDLEGSTHPELVTAIDKLFSRLFLISFYFE